MPGEVRLGLYFIDEMQSSGKRLDLYFIDWLVIQSSAKSNFINPYKQGILVLTDLLECWWFGPVWKIKKTRCASQFL